MLKYKYKMKKEINMEFDFDLFVDDFVNTIMYDIENTEGEKEFYRKNDIKETIESKVHERNA